MSQFPDFRDTSGQAATGRAKNAVFPIGNIDLDLGPSHVYIPDREYHPELTVSTPAPAMIELTSAKALGKAIRDARTKMGLQQAEAALLCGVGIRYLSDLENGKETVRLEQALKVIAGLGLVLTIGPKEPFWSKKAMSRNLLNG